MPMRSPSLSQAGVRSSHGAAGAVGRGQLLCVQPQHAGECCAGLCRVVKLSG